MNDLLALSPRFRWVY